MLNVPVAKYILLCFLLHGSSSNRIRTGTVKEEFQNNHCTTDSSGSPTCQHWINQPPVATKRSTSVPECQYYEMVRTSACYNTPLPPENATPLCTRKRHYFEIKTACYNHWLKWSTCTAKCGGGTKSRYEFSSHEHFLTQTKSCNTHSCATWTDWQASSSGCQSTCQQLFTRSCMYRGAVTSPSRCTHRNLSDIEHDTHHWRTCVGGACIPTTTTAATAKTSSTSKPIFITNQEKPNTNNQDSKEDRSIEDFSFFLSKTFWIGYCIGVASAIIFVFLVILIYFRTKTGKLTFSLIKANSKKKIQKSKEYINGGRRDSKTRQMQILHADVINVPVHERRMPDPPLPSFSNMLRESEGYRNQCDHSMYQSGGSVHNHSKYIESINPNLIDSVEYETFYTPVGESKMHSRSSEHSRSELLPEMPARRLRRVSSESFVSDSESDCYSDRHRDRIERGSSYQNDSAYYGESSGRKLEVDHFDKNSYLRELDAARAERRKRKSSKERRSRKSRSDDKSRRSGDCRRHTRRQESIDSQTTIEYSRHPEVHYARPIKTPRRDRQSNTEATTTPDSEHERNIILSQQNSASTRCADDSFEFPIPPNLNEPRNDNV